METPPASYDKHTPTRQHPAGVGQHCQLRVETPNLLGYLGIGQIRRHIGDANLAGNN